MPMGSNPGTKMPHSEPLERSEVVSSIGLQTALSLGQSLRRVAAPFVVLAMVSSLPARAETFGDAVMAMMKGARVGCDCRDACFVGTIVQKLEGGRYEVVIPLNMDLWGNGDRDEGRALTVVLKTTKTRFESAGDVGICINATFSVSKMKGENGFQGDYLTFTEGRSGYANKVTYARPLESAGLTDEAFFKGAMLEAKYGFDECVRGQEERAPGESGRVVMQWVVRPNGTAANIRCATEKYTKTSLAECLTARLKSMTFSKRLARPAPFEWPVDFGGWVESAPPAAKPEQPTNPKREAVSREELMRKAQAAREAGNFDEATAYLQQCIEESPDFYGCYGILGRVYDAIAARDENDEGLVKAIAAYERYLALAPSTAVFVPEVKARLDADMKRLRELADAAHVRQLPVHPSGPNE